MDGVLSQEEINALLDGGGVTGGSSDGGSRENHTLYVLLCLLLSLSILFSGSVHMVANVRASLFFRAG